MDWEETRESGDADSTLQAWRQFYVLRLVDAHYTYLAGAHDVEQVLHLLNRCGALYAAAADLVALDTLI